jgi:aryl-alcohol dehydrogenase-like predicted oxidoreductase
VKRGALPGTEIVVSRLSFGTASLHHLPTPGRRQALLAEAAALGFSHFDASPYYGFGVAEHELGVFLRGRGDALTVASKVGLYPPGGRKACALFAWSRKAAGRWIPALSRVVVDWSVTAAEKSLARSLRALGRDRVDVLFLHEPAPGLLDAEEFLFWLAQQRRAGKIRHWGLAGPLNLFSAWTNHSLAEILQVRDSDVPSLVHAGAAAAHLRGAFVHARRPHRPGGDSSRAREESERIAHRLDAEAGASARAGACGGMRDGDPRPAFSR